MGESSTYMYVYIHTYCSVKLHDKYSRVLDVHVFFAPCPVYYSGRGRHYVGNDVVDESAEPLVFWCALRI